MLSDKEYMGDLDREFFAAHNVTVVKNQPWQFSLTHPDLKGKFVWYPKKGTLMFEGIVKSGGFASRYKVGEYSNSERVYTLIMTKINNQQNG
jgi:hypothetical protein|tara:strand:+ start:3509 stop:3784 length:276 start_codon:yes stop_codon:yes gene_type:complete